MTDLPYMWVAAGADYNLSSRIRELSDEEDMVSAPTMAFMQVRAWHTVRSQRVGGFGRQMLGCQQAGGLLRSGS